MKNVFLLFDTNSKQWAMEDETIIIILFFFIALLTGIQALLLKILKWLGFFFNPFFIYINYKL